MRILLTGASSFTGYWFARELSRAGHQVTATFRSNRADYQGVRLGRVGALQGLVEAAWGIEFGDERFLGLIRAGQFDLLLHHGAEMTNYRSWEFDALAATQANTRSARDVLTSLAAGGGQRLVITGSVFEPYEGVGDSAHRAFNPYGLSKHLTFELFRIEAERLGLSLGKFVIPNPFGPMEEMRFTSYLAREWAAGRVPEVSTPAYVRDNIPISLLATAYRCFCESLPPAAGLSRSGPSGYIESQGAFARRMAREIGSRWRLVLEINEARQTDFPEPQVRTNCDLAAPEHPDWSESAAWDQLSDYYETAFLAAEAH